MAMAIQPGHLPGADIFVDKHDLCRTWRLAAQGLDLCLHRVVRIGESLDHQHDIVGAREGPAPRLQQDIDSLQAELQLIQQPGFVSSAAHGYMLGLPGEIPFTIDGNVPAPAANAPGSVGIARQNVASPDSPLDAWLAALFGGR